LAAILGKGLLGTRAEVPADLALAVQAIVIVILLIGLRHAKRKNFDRHGKIMASAVILSGITVVAWMIPTLIDSFGILVNELVTRGKHYYAAIVTVAHAVGGLTAAALALYTIARITLNLPPGIRVKNIKLLMRVTFTTWMLTFVLGTYIYYMLYL